MAGVPSTAEVVLDPAHGLAEVPRRIFGSFAEHMGRCIYGGIYQPDHAAADEEGSRTDVLQLVREMGVSLVRYPGGNFVSSYRWEDGIGPRADRPRRLNLAWRCMESNEFGLNEFISWTKKANVEPMMSVNLGTRGVAEACDIVEYCNHPQGTYWSDLRREHGFAQPHDIKLWCLGNEMDGPWQVGAKTPTEYGRLAAETAKAMRIVDPSIELIAVGSSHSAMPTFGEWEQTLLEHAYDQIDYVSLHHYFDPDLADEAGFLASGELMDRFITDVVSTCDHMRAKLRRDKVIRLSFDEWNVWYQSRFTEPLQRDWIESPALIEDNYTARDAVVVGDLLITLLRHADRVAMANQAQLVNVIAPIRAAFDGPAWRQEIFHPFALTAALANGTVLDTQTRVARYDTDKLADVPLLSSVATTDPQTGRSALFVVNRADHEMELRVDARALGTAVSAIEHLAVAAGEETSEPALADVSPPIQRPKPVVADGVCMARLPSQSWSVIQFASMP